MSKTTKVRHRKAISIPSREEVLSFLRKSGKPCTLTNISKGLKVGNQEHRAALGNRLKAMVRDGQLIRNRREGYGLIEKMDLIPGKVIGHPDGYGFVVPDDGDDGDLYLSAKQMRRVLHGDRAAVRVAGTDKRGRREGALVEVLERANSQVVGRYFEEGDIGFVVPDNKRLSQDIIIPTKYLGKAAASDFVLVEISRQPDKHTQPVGRIVDVLGHHEQSGIAAEIAIRSFELPHVWPEDLLEQIEGLKPDSKIEVADRLDLRELPFVTIDGEDARDFDDAVYCEKDGVAWKLFVAIADVSHYVTPGTALDTEAQKRGTSVYFPNRVIPMLPEILSNELCSLKPDVDRLSMVCEMQISKQGKVKKHDFHNAIIRSSARLTYSEMADIVVEKKKKKRQRREEILSNLDDLYSLYRLINGNRKKQGLLDFDSSESFLSFDDEGRVENIQAMVRNDAHRLIEEFMLAANVSTANYLLDAEIPALYRNHDTPKLEKLSDLKDFLSELGLSLEGGDKPKAKHYAKLIEAVNKRADGHMIKTVLLRSLPLANYSEENLGHFGLAFDAYTHFTSPIRRYPDLLVHRAIRHLIAKSKKKKIGYSKQEMHLMAEHSSLTERRAEEASRDVVQRMKCEYMKDKVGDVFEGTITSVTSFGLFVELDEVFVEGLVHVTALPGDYYHFDAIGHRLQGERTGKTYRLANRIKVKIVRVSVDDRKIDFELAD
ncbi:MAG: ribonuclease R [Gammaproteobacteria bacterium]|nr:ribonuclease R [Gammaproteobacteria bacterium]